MSEYNQYSVETNNPNMNSSDCGNNLPPDSSLRPTAPEYFPVNSNNGAIKKRTNYPKSYIRGHSFPNSENSNIGFSSGAIKKSPDKKTTEGKFHYNKYKRYNADSSYETSKKEFQTYKSVYNNSYKSAYNQQMRRDHRYDSQDSNYDRTSSRAAKYRENSKFDQKYNLTRTENRHNQHFTKKNARFNQNSNGIMENGKNNIVSKTAENRRANISGQRERLIEMIDHNALECLVCCDKIRNYEKTWSCVQCFHVVHLNCIITWATSSKIDGSWRCPACQNLYDEVPYEYRCYCGKLINPKFDPNLIAHACGDVCLKRGKNCDHKCSILCHPGPCPECNIMVSKPCGCGQTEQIVKCSSVAKFVCNAYCNKTLNCGIHQCLEKCHFESCPPCKKFIIQECYCGKSGRKVLCDPQQSGRLNFACENTCDKLLSCSNHKCHKQCHSGPCNPCDSDINVIKSCCCGKTPLEIERDSCLDPIPCCDQVCDKLLQCGHTCKEKCHNGVCPMCPLVIETRCRCNNLQTKIACKELISMSNEVLCEKKCSKKRTCGKHKCSQKCCIDPEHICLLPCNRLLFCGLHRCQRTCHFGRCPPCLETSFEELYCECGASVLYPPIPCGKKPPICSNPCSKPRPCGHPPNHECHTGPCPPCFVLTKKWCYRKHEERGTIPCSQEYFSCGMPCGKPMPCQRHKCIKPCHGDECPVPCTQPCSVPRKLCGHPCNKPCHNSPCPESNCKQLVAVTCQCSFQKGSKVCMDLTEEYHNIEMEQIKDKINQCDDITDITSRLKKVSILKVMDCNDECRIYERNRRLAIGLQIQNPDLSQKLTPRYSDYLKQWAKKDAKFCQRIHDKLTELVQLAKQSKQKSRSHSFESMNRDKRHFIHEYCEYFGVESEAYDREPNRNVVATAIKDKSWLPSMSLLEVIQRENGQRKVPGPMLGYRAASHPENVSLKILNKVQK